MRVWQLAAMVTVGLQAGLGTHVLAQEYTRDTTQRRVQEVGPRAKPIQAPDRKVPATRSDRGSSEVACAGFVRDLWEWVNENRGAHAGAHRVGAKMAVVKIRDRRGEVYPWGHGAYSEGGFGWSGANLVGRFQVLFSDRRATASGNRFDHSKADIQDVTLYTDGRVEVQLRSWGNTLLSLEDVTCFGDGFLTGIKREGNGVSLVSFALRKEVLTPDSHPGTVWP